MLGLIRGKILNRSGDSVAIAVGDPSHSFLGYLVHLPRRSQYEVLQEGEDLQLFLHTHVREDALELFGFATQEEKELFLLLLNVNGVGPKLAMTILSHMEPKDFVKLIVEGNRGGFQKIQGVGAKILERLFLELKDPFKKKIEKSNWANWVHAAKPVSGARSEKFNRNIYSDAKQALMGLGYRENEVDQMIDYCVGIENYSPSSVEDLIKEALKGRA